VGFEVDVENISKAAAKLGNGKPPTLSADGSPNVGGTDRAADYAGDYEVWLLTRKEDLEAAQQQVEALVESIKLAAKSYDATDDAARDAFLKTLDSGFAKIDR
jgi:ABC-type nitrate/sulfonate/bicarbonate transport system substrate-binding protein